METFYILQHKSGCFVMWCGCGWLHVDMAQASRMPKELAEKSCKINPNLKAVEVKFDGERIVEMKVID